ncbi:MAG: hypothetical protein WC324_06515 [Candidatus Omnitrophota bacterium]|jgi:hypothetical protein
MITTHDLHGRRLAVLKARREARLGISGAAPVLVSGISDGEWAGEPCFIIGGGASLKGFDFNRLRGKGRIIAINRAYESVPFADIHFFMDNRYYKRVQGEAEWQSFPGRKVYLNMSGYPVERSVISVRQAGRVGLSRSIREGLYHGNNSGVGAIGLAYCLGANPIYLMGYDCNKVDNASHFHDGYEGVPTADRVLAGFVKDFDALAALVTKTGTKVINLNPDSAIRSFAFGKIDEIKSGKRGGFFATALGFGDNLYQRAILKVLARRFDTVYLQTTCPDIYWDIPNVRFVEPGSVPLRTQRKYLASLPRSTFSPRPPLLQSLGWRYKWNLGMNVCHVDWLRQQSGVTLDQFDFSFMVKAEWIRAAWAVLARLDMKGKRLCLVRPSTIRKEWYNASRNPKAAHMQRIIDTYRDDYFYLSFADLEPGVEWLDGELKGIDAEFHRGELPLTTIFGLIKLSEMVLTGPTWTMVAAIAERVKCFTIFGGCARPERIIDASMGLDRFAYVAPEPFCDCRRGDHACNKEIPPEKVIAQFEELRRRSVWQ